MNAPLLALLLAAADPCAAATPATKPDPEAAAVYRAVGASELARGARGSAIVAYQEAAARDPADAASRDALRGLCSEPPPEDPHREGLRRMDARDWPGAAAAFQAASKGEAGPSATLLEGICRYEIGEDGEAAGLLKEAATYPPHREEAQFYLGLEALRTGSPSEAASLFESASASPALGHAATDLARLARRDGRLVPSVFAESGWDSNVNLAPSGAQLGPPASDGVYGLTATGLYRPSGPEGPYLRLSGFMQEQASLSAFDFSGYDAGAGWQLGRGERGLIAEYDYGARTFGGISYLSAHRLLGSGWLRAGGALSARATSRGSSHMGLRGNASPGRCSARRCAGRGCPPRGCGSRWPMAAAETRREIRSCRSGSRVPGPSCASPELVSESEAMKRALAAANQVAATDATVLLLGESGTGKSQLARFIHYRSKRAAAPLVECTVRRSRRRFSRASCSGTRKAPSRARPPARRATSRRRMAAPCSSTRSARSRRRRR